MKLFLLLLLLFPATILFSQNKSFRLGEEVEYFNNRDWIDSKVLQVGNDGRYLLMLDHNPNKTKWFYGSEINSLEVLPYTVVEVKVVETQEVVGIVFHVGDTVKYQENDQWFRTEIFKIEPDKMYQVFTDTSHTGITFKHEKELVLIKCIAESVSRDTQTVSTYSFKPGEQVEYYHNEQWHLGTIGEINAALTSYLITLPNGSASLFEHQNIRKPVPAELRQVKKDIYEAGDKIYYYNGSEWIESEIIQIGENDQYQVYYNTEKTVTKWIDVKELR